MTSADLVDAEGHRYPASVCVRDAVTPTGIRHEFRVRADNVPPDAQLTEVTGVLLHQNPITIPVDLP